SSSIRDVLGANPALFLPVYKPGAQQAYLSDHLFRNLGDGRGATYQNRYAEIVHGYSEWWKSKIQVQDEHHQDFSKLMEGLRYRGLDNASRSSRMEYRRQYNPFYYMPGSVDPNTGAYSFLNLNPLGGTEYLGYSENGRGQESVFYMENAINYDRT